MLLGYKKSPQTAVDKMEEWVRKVRRTRNRSAATRKGAASGRAVQEKKVIGDPDSSTDALTGSLSSVEPPIKQDSPVVADA